MKNLCLWKSEFGLMTEEIFKLQLITYLKGNLFSTLSNHNNNCVGFCFVLFFYNLVEKEKNFLISGFECFHTCQLNSDVLPNNAVAAAQKCHPSVRRYTYILSFIFQLEHWQYTYKYICADQPLIESFVVFMDVTG